jgi:arginyl-tRNA synthetase|nr:MAG TPA: hypothetical protein [Caudoviricetes sp.]
MTAQELVRQDESGVYSEQDIAYMLVKFAKYHVQEALKEASDKFDAECNKYVILNAYPLENIK